jgi:hypothetical protein
MMTDEFETNTGINNLSEQHEYPRKGVGADFITYRPLSFVQPVFLRENPKIF